MGSALDNGSVGEITDGDIVVVLSPAGALIGRLTRGEGEWILRKPRAVHVSPAGHGQMQINLLPLVGAPDAVFFPETVPYFTPTEKPMINGYIEATSGIKLASSSDVPRRVN